MKKIILSCLLALSLPAAQANIIKGLFNALLTNHFHTITPGAAYRSGTMKPRSLARKIKKYGIKSVINLRGAQHHEKWWQRENKLMRKLGLNFYNIEMSAHTLPSRRNIIELLDLFEHAPRPLLIHCQAGADRTSEAAALWKLTQDRVSKEEALKQLSSSYGHLRGRYPAKRFFIRILPDRNIRQWITHHYDPHVYTQFAPPHSGKKKATA